MKIQMPDFRAAHQWLHGLSAALDGRDPTPDDEAYAGHYVSGYTVGLRTVELVPLDLPDSQPPKVAV